MSKIIGAYIEITGKCNENCPYRYNEKLVSSGDSLSLTVLTNLLLQLKDHGISTVAFSGGEPFLYDNLPDILAEARRREISILIITNGTCFETQNIEILKEYKPGLQITFDGWNAASHDKTRGSGNFEKITTGIKCARKSGYLLPINIRINLNKKNIKYIPEFLSMMEHEFDVDGEALEIASINMAMLHKTETSDGTYDDYLEFEAYLEYPEIFDHFNDWNNRHVTQISYDFNNPDIGCAYNADVDNVRCGLRIALDGNVFPCQLFTDDKFSIGNVCEMSITDIMNGNKLEAFIDMVHKRKGNIEKCKSCGYFNVCSGGCPAMAYIENGIMNSVSSRCKTRKSGLNKSLLQILNKHRI